MRLRFLPALSIFLHGSAALFVYAQAETSIQTRFADTLFGRTPAMESSNEIWQLSADGRFLHLSESGIWYTDPLRKMTKEERTRFQHTEGSNVSWSLNFRRQLPGKDLFLTFGLLERGWNTENNEHWIGLRDGATQQVTPLYRSDPKTPLIWHQITDDGSGIIGTVQWPLEALRQPPEADRPVTEDVNSRLLVSTHYTKQTSWLKQKRAYPGAEHGSTREIIVLFDFATRQEFRVLSGNDIADVQLSPDRQKILAIQGLSSLSAVRNDHLVDIYVADVPARSDMSPLLRDRVAAEELNLGWFDHRRRRLDPAVKGAHFIASESSGNRTRGQRLVQWSPDSTRFAYAEIGRGASGDVFVYDLSSRKLQNVTTGAAIDGVVPRIHEPFKESIRARNSPRFGSLEPIRWTPDGRSILVAARGYLWKVDADGYGVENLSEHAGPLGIVSVASSSQRRYLAYEGTPGRVLVRTTDKETLRDGYAWFDMTQRRLVPIFETSGLVVDAFTDDVSGRLYYLAIGPRDAGEAYMVDLNKRASPLQFTNFAKSLEGLELPESNLLTFATASGRKGWARIHYPPGLRRDAKLPLIVMPQLGIGSGHTARSTWNDGGEISVLEFWRWWGVQLLNESTEQFLKAGFAVLYFDVPLKSKGDNDEFRQATLEAYHAATDAALVGGRIDPAKLALFGNGIGAWSINPAFMVQLVVGDTDRYAAAVSINGFGSLESQALSSPRFANGRGGWVTSQDYVQAHYRIAAPYARDPARYRRNSALHFLGKTKTPLLLIHNEQNKSFLPERSHEAFSALDASQTRSVLALYNKGERATSEIMRRAFYWLNEHLRGGPSVSGRATLPNLTAADAGVMGEAPDLEIPPTNP